MTPAIVPAIDDGTPLSKKDRPYPMHSLPRSNRGYHVGFDYK